MFVKINDETMWVPGVENSFVKDQELEEFWQSQKSDKIHRWLIGEGYIWEGWIPFSSMEELRGALSRELLDRKAQVKETKFKIKFAERMVSRNQHG